MAGGKFYTAFEDAVIVERAKTAGGWKQIADELGRSVSGLKDRAVYLGVRLDRANTETVRLAKARAATSSPEHRAKQRAGAILHWQNHPERRARLSELSKARNSIAACKTTTLTPEEVERRRLAGVVAHGRSQTAWLPDDYRNEYLRLMRYKKFSAAEARAAIEADIFRDLRRALRSIAAAVPEIRRQYYSFEAELARVQAGAAVREVVPLRARELDFSVVGSSLA